MTYDEAIGFMRTVLDENGIEYYSDAEMIDALRQAEVDVMRELWRRGDKTALRGLYREIFFVGQVSPVIPNVVFVETCQVNVDAANASTPTGAVNSRVVASYKPPLHWTHYRASLQSGAAYNRYPAYYTYTSDTFVHNGHAAVVCYYVAPAILPRIAQMQLGGYTHGMTIDRALLILTPKDATAQDQAPVGAIYDIARIASSGEKQ
jgi:hypothetical protein